VDLTLPRAFTSLGHTYPAGRGHLSGTAALAYLRQPSLTDLGRVMREQSLIRAMLGTIATDRRLLTSPATAYRVLRALTAALTVDSGFTSAGLTSLVSELRGLGDGAATFVTLPVAVARVDASATRAGATRAGATRAGGVRAGPVAAGGGRLYPEPGLSRRLWQAFRQGTLAAFARGNPGTVTPAEVP
jgi:hypothetical protein